MINEEQAILIVGAVDSRFADAERFSLTQSYEAAKLCAEAALSRPAARIPLADAIERLYVEGNTDVQADLAISFAPEFVRIIRASGVDLAIAVMGLGEETRSAIADEAQALS